jgi:outer membrane protein TolC
VSDPSTETWRAAVGQSTSAQLRQTQAALAASQADLTRVEAELRVAYRDIEDLTARLGLETEARAGAVIALHAAEKQLTERNTQDAAPPRRPYGTEDLDPRREPHR